MFQLSPIYWLARKSKEIEGMTEEEKRAQMEKVHRVPSALVNWLLSAIIAAETPLGYWVRFPWGTSVLGVFRKPTGVSCRV